MKTFFFYLIMLIILTSAILTSLGKIPYMGGLPGDITFRQGALHIKIPFTTIAIYFALLFGVYFLFSRKK
jgi:hypothetical protein